MSNITISDVEQVAKLARLELTEEEKEKYTKELGEILNFVDELNEVSDAELNYKTDLTNIARTDEITHENDRENLLFNAPTKENGFISVPQIFDSKKETSFPEAEPKDANE